ncbi:MAG TPA: WYL domain-containing protein [Anaerolineae bacterium]
MRADRLLTLLMLLQTRGRLTAQELAKELEVSERTVYRDIDALSASGVPVYAETGPGGGCALLDSYRTTLTGLTSDEVRALFMLSIPAPLDQLGVTQELKQALLKLSAALPDARRSDEARSRQRIHLDSTWWFQSEDALPHLATLYQAVWVDRKVQLTLRLKFGTFIETQVERLIAPYGLVAKTNVWYVVCASESELRVHRVSDISMAQLTDEPFSRCVEFDLVDFWQAWCAGVEADRSSYPVTLRLRSDFVPLATHYLGEHVREPIEQARPPDPQGRITATITFESLEDARSRCLSLGRAVEVLEPEALRRSLIDYAAQISAVYAE